MIGSTNKRRAMLSWVFVSTLVALCGVLGVLQYRWIGKVSVAARDRLHASLQASLTGLSEDFNGELFTAVSALVPSNTAVARTAQQQFEAHYKQWRRSARNGRLFDAIAMAIPEEDSLSLLSVDLQTGSFQPANWPPAWDGLRSRLESNLLRRDLPHARGAALPMQPPPRPPQRAEEGSAFEIPLFGQGGPGSRGEHFNRAEFAWMIFQVNPQFAREVMLPELIQRHLAGSGGLDYQVEVVSRGTPGVVLYRSGPDLGADIVRNADASVALFDPQYESPFRRGGPPPGRDRDHGQGRGFAERGPGRGSGRGPGGGGGGRWEMYARHRAGSLEAAVSQVRLRNLAVTGGVLLLMLATIAALIRFTSRAQKLAEMQMEFVAGVSHELRTPLTVIHTAGYNLQGKMAHNPAQVERYGALIQQESGRLRALVEQVLRFASGNAGRVIQRPEPLSIVGVIEETLEASRRMAEESQCAIETKIDPGIPAVMGDPVALRHALENLVSNAVKYGGGGNWVGVFAGPATAGGNDAVEIRVADHGRGIPKEEQDQIFDPFFRGAGAVQEQVHGTGLGLSLVKKIVEAHGGTIRVESDPAKGTEFIMSLPAMPAGALG